MIYAKDGIEKPLTLGKMVNVLYKLLDQVHYYILENTDGVKSYIK